MVGRLGEAITVKPRRGPESWRRLDTVILSVVGGNLKGFYISEVTFTDCLQGADGPALTGGGGSRATSRNALDS
jgi:hypothetical protein